jgi:hypothetical protein
VQGFNDRKGKDRLRKVWGARPVHELQHQRQQGGDVGGAHAIDLTAVQATLEWPDPAAQKLVEPP